jgi:hypothetical protein
MIGTAAQALRRAGKVLTMQLPPDQVERFYAIWKPLLLFVNEQRRLVPSMLGMALTDHWDINKVQKIRNVLWKEDSLREAFIAQNPAGLSAEDLAIVDSWQYRRAGKYFVLRHLKSHTIFLADKGKEVFAVLGLASPLEEIVPFVPCYVDAVLLPFEDRIIYDSLIAPYNITFGRGIQDNLNQIYKDAKELGTIHTSLLPQGPVSREEQQGEAYSTNAKVLDAFRKHLYRSGLSPKVVERDVGYVETFAEQYLANQPEPRSLRDFGEKEISGYLSQLRTEGPLTDAQRRQAVTSFKRLARFLRDTERMDYDVAQDLMDLLKQEK